jgi:hypothetical protein
MSGSDFVAVTCIVAGGVLGGLGWNALEGVEPEAPEVRGCAGVVVTSLSAPDVIVKVGDRDRIVIASRTANGPNVQVACGEITATAEELRERTERARLRVLDLRSEVGPPEAPDAPRVRLLRVPGEPR